MSLPSPTRLSTSSSNRTMGRSFSFRPAGEQAAPAGHRGDRIHAARPGPTPVVSDYPGNDGHLRQSRWQSCAYPLRHPRAPPGRAPGSIQGRVISFRVESFHQGQQTAGLAGLARGVENEIAFLPDQAPDFIHIPTLQRGNVIVLVRSYGACCVEGPHRSSVLPCLRYAPLMVTHRGAGDDGLQRLQLE